MNSLAFWKSWNNAYKFLFWILFTALLAGVVYFWYAYYQNPAPFITWERFQQLNTESATVETFTKGIFQIPVTADNFLVFEILSGSEPQPSALPVYIFLVAISLALVMLLTIVSAMSRYWYIIGIGVFSLIILIMPLDTLQIFGLANRIPAFVIVLLFGVTSYYFHALQKHRSIQTRFFTFSGLLIAVLIAINQFSQAPLALLHFSANGYTLAVILTIAFILTVAHEIPVSFINVITRGNRQSKSLQHYIVISVFYLLNLLLAYGIKTGYMSVNLWTIDFYLLLTISSLLSVWGFRQREAQYESMFPADPVGVYFILALGIASFGSLSYFMASANDTVLTVMRDLIIYSHLGYGLIFVFYVFANFGSMLNQNLQVHKVLFKPNTMPYFTFRLMGLICTFAFLLFDTNWRTPVNQLFAGYYNNYGDLYLLGEDAAKAEEFYKKSIFFRNQNHHAHYAIAAIQAARLEPFEQMLSLKAAAESNPPQQTVVNLSDAYRQSGKTADALLAIDVASSKHKNAGALQNAKGLIFMQLNMSDSSLNSFQQSRKESSMKEIAETNLLAASAKFKLTYPADSLLLLLDSEKEGPKTNALALANLQNIAINVEYQTPTDTVLSATRAAFLCNYVINQKQKIDTLLLAQIIELGRRPVNDPFKEHILTSCAHAYYSQGRVKRAFELTREIAYSVGKGKYFELLGTWALEQDNAQVAADYFAIAREKGQPRAGLFEAVAITETKNLSEAKLRWSELLASPDSINKASISKLIKVIDATPAQAMSFDDEGKYLYCRYKLSLNDSVGFKSLVSTISNQELKVKSLVEYAERWFAIDEAAVAARFLNMADGLTPDQQTTLTKFYCLHGMLLSESNSWDELRELIKDNTLLETYYRNHVIYWKALLNQKDGNKEQAAQLFNHLAYANMYFDEAVVTSSQYMMENTEDPLKAYGVLVNGLMARPNSVKMLKAYIKQAALVGFDDEAAESLDKLRGLISTKAFNQYLKENPDFFTLE